ncbi:MAG: hypothetical protein K5880_13935 [Hydrogenophaga sp.]|uniref:hypothetical protein n=1 Tax=Hydrogenophaga sp. TaxID=1904254 RepID=UPI002616EC72|nr:hypothetical protein [Hydrogenophaga sp.]MCV0439722.1 hypothetical protein [Hydrogenophaga sp.]
MTTITVSWTSGGKDVKVAVECRDGVIGWEEHCATKVGKAVEAMEAIFPPDGQDEEGEERQER